MAISLTEQLRIVWSELYKCGWGELLEAAGLALPDGLSAEELTYALAQPIKAVDRTLPGFEDFHPDGCCGIMPGSPAQSLLFHALASPAVRAPDSRPGFQYPSQKQIQIVLEYVYSVPAALASCAAGIPGISVPSLSSIRKRVPGGAFLAIVVFAEEYRAASSQPNRSGDSAVQDTGNGINAGEAGGGVPHGLYADMCYSRTGIARVGTAEPLYLPEDRGWGLGSASIPAADPIDEPVPLPVVPVRYAAYLATQFGGSAAILGQPYVQARDSQLGFWVPLHRLFDGTECLDGLELTVILTPSHTNQKLKAFHATLQARNEPSGWSGAILDLPPFSFTEQIAEFDKRYEAKYGTGLLVPEVHPALVEAATLNGNPVTFAVTRHAPRDTASVFSSSINVFPDLSAPPTGSPPTSVVPRSLVEGAPAYINARHEVLRTSEPHEPPHIRNLNREANVANLVLNGGYDAQHYIDFTGDGFIKASCVALETRGIIRSLAAYSVVAPPDFYPRVSQRFLADFAAALVPPKLSPGLWRIPPQPLASLRVPANLSLPDAGFMASDLTMTAVITAPVPANLSPMLASFQPLVGIGEDAAPNRQLYRDSGLPDDAAGMLAPGWDIAVDRQPGSGVEFLASYGLGSPFPEDTKLCAALSAFWVAAAPDTARTFKLANSFPATVPLTDEEIGLASPDKRAWDGIQGPELDDPQNPRFVRYTSFDNADYVDTALEGQFRPARTFAVGPQEYARRALVMLRIYRALGINIEDVKDEPGSIAVLGQQKAKFNLIQFQQFGAPPNNEGLAELVRTLNVPLEYADELETQWAFYVHLHQPQSGPHPDPANPLCVLVPYSQPIRFFAGPSWMIRQNGSNSPWEILLA